MNPQSGPVVSRLLHSIGYVVLSAFALYQIPREKNPLAGADKTTWIYRNIGPQKMEVLLLIAFALLLLYGLSNIVRSAIFFMARAARRALNASREYSRAFQPSSIASLRGILSQFSQRCVSNRDAA